MYTYIVLRARQVRHHEVRLGPDVNDHGRLAAPQPRAERRVVERDVAPRAMY